MNGSTDEVRTEYVLTVFTFSIVIAVYQLAE